MKATEVFNRYAKGERDFRGVNLRGQNFQGQDLSGADFSEAKIHSTNFTHTILRGTNFTKAQAGVKKRWLGVQQGVAFLLSLLTTFLSMLSGIVIGSLFSEQYADKQVTFIAGIFVFLLIVFGFGTITHQGFTTKAFVTIAIVFAVAFAVAVALALTIFTAPGFSTYAADGAVLIVVAAAGVVAFAIAGTFTVAVATAFNFAFAMAIAIAIAVAIGVTIASGVDNVVVLAGAVAGAAASILLSSYCSRRAFQGVGKFTIIRSVGVTWSALGGTSFRGAILTEADFTQAILKNVDFRNATLTHTCWFGAKKLDRSRIEGTYLENPAIRQLVISKDGQDRMYDGYNLRGLNLQDGALNGASFIAADLSEANLNNADLTKAKLAEAQLYGTDLANACLTKACIQNWAISTDTRLENVQCEEIYMRLPTDDDPDPWRKPDNRRETFKPGDFTDFIAPIIKTLDLYRQQSIDPREVGNALKTLDLYHYGEINPTAAAIALKQLAEENPNAELEVAALEGRGEEKIHLQAVVRGIGDSAQLSADYFQKYREISALPLRDIQTLLTVMAEKDDRIRSLEKILATPKEGNSYYIQAGRDISGVLNLGNISGNVTNTINQSPHSPDARN